MILLKISRELYCLVILCSFCRKFFCGGIIFIFLVIGFIIIFVMFLLNCWKVSFIFFKLLYGMVMVFFVMFLGISGLLGRLRVVIFELVLIKRELLCL